MLIDETPLYDLIDDFRKDCMLARVLNGCMDAAIAQRLQAGLSLPPGVSRYAKNVAIDFDACHVLDFGYLFNVGSGKPDTLAETEVAAIKEHILDHGISLAYPKMLLVERTSVAERRLFITSVYEKNGQITVEYYCKDRDEKHWIKVGHLENVSVESAGVMAFNLKAWGIMVPRDAMPQDDGSPINHWLRMTVTLLAMLMRRGDDVEQVFVERNRDRPLKGIQRRNVQSVSIIRLNKPKLIPNLVDEAEATEVRTVRPHDRAGTVSHRIKSLTCEHAWVEEYRDINRWRNRCPKCDSCEFWRSDTKVKGGAQTISFHTVVP